MGKRGPKSTKISLIEKSSKKRPFPLRGMSPSARNIWKRICSAYHPEHFKPQQYDLLRMYSENAAINKIALGNAAKENYTENRWLEIAQKSANQCTALATKLGITVNSTMEARGKGGSAPKPKSKREGLLYGGQKR